MRSALGRPDRHARGIEVCHAIHIRFKTRSMFYRNVNCCDHVFQAGGYEIGSYYFMADSLCTKQAFLKKHVATCEVSLFDFTLKCTACDLERMSLLYSIKAIKWRVRHLIHAS